MRIAHLMHEGPLTTFPDERLADAVQRMHEHGIGALVVMEGTLSR